MSPPEEEYLRLLRDAGERLGRPAGGKRRKQQFEPREALRHEVLDRELSRRVPDQRRKAKREGLAGARITAHIRDLEGRVGGAQAQELASAVAADADDPDSHGRILPASSRPAAAGRTPSCACRDRSSRNAN